LQRVLADSKDEDETPAFAHSSRWKC
jgi:hypothetical protein